MHKGEEREMRIQDGRREGGMRSILGVVMVGAALTMAVAGVAYAADSKAHTDFYGYVMMDAGYNSIGVDPAWFDVQRPTKLAAFENQFGDKGNTFFSVRQTRFGVKSYIPTEKGELKTTFEWELFGVGVDAGQTTIRLRHAYGELGKFGAGQTWSPFMDIDVFPNSLEYWGPTGMVFFRNVQFRYMPIMSAKQSLTLALERPGASGDAGAYAGRVELAGITPRFPLPDLSAEYRMARKWGYVEFSGIVRQIKWEDLSPVPVDLSGNVTGWGLHVSSNLKPTKNDVVRLSVVHGEGIENYMNDAPADVGVKVSGATFEGVALPVTGVVAFLDHTWNAKYTSSIGYSQVIIENSNGQAPDAFHLGQYVLANLLYSPVTNVMMGVEGGWIHRDNLSDGWSEDDTHIQVSFKYSFATSVGGGH
jgi:hypothetical protein